MDWMLHFWNPGEIWHAFIYDVMSVLGIMNGRLLLLKCNIWLQIHNDYDQKSLARIVCVQCSLACMGFGSRALIRMPQLIPQQEMQHFIWTCDVPNWSLEDWQHVHSESQFHLFWDSNGVQVLHRYHETMDPCYQQDTMHNGMGCVHTFPTFLTIFTYSWVKYIPITMTGYSNRIMHYVIG